MHVTGCCSPMELLGCLVRRSLVGTSRERMCMPSFALVLGLLNLTQLQHHGSIKQNPLPPSYKHQHHPQSPYKRFHHKQEPQSHQNRQNPISANLGTLHHLLPHLPTCHLSSYQDYHLPSSISYTCAISPTRRYEHVHDLWELDVGEGTSQI